MGELRFQAQNLYLMTTNAQHVQYNVQHWTSDQQTRAILL